VLRYWTSNRFGLLVGSLLLTLCCGVVGAEEPEQGVVVDEELPFEPGVRIYQEDGKQVEEYSINGRVYKVKITPSIGPSYYLVDRDGDGELETRHSALKGIPPIPQWVLFRW